MKRKSAERNLVKANKLIATMERIDQFKAEVFSRYDVTLYAEYGRKYCKLTIGSSVFCFIDIQTGDVLKAATYSAPAKHPRSNIWSDDCGVNGVNKYGGIYLR